MGNRRDPEELIQILIDDKVGKTLHDAHAKVCAGKQRSDKRKLLNPLAGDRNLVEET